MSTEGASFYDGGSFLQRRLISTEEANFNTTGLYLYGKQEPLHRGEMALFYSVWQWH